MQNHAGSRCNCKVLVPATWVLGDVHWPRQTDIELFLSEKSLRPFWQMGMREKERGIKPGNYSATAVVRLGVEFESLPTPQGGFLICDVNIFLNF